MGLLEDLRASTAGIQTGISYEKLPEGQNFQEVSVSARQKNLDLANKISSESFKKQGIDLSKAKRGIDIAQEITRNSSDFLSKNEDSIARDLYYQRYQRQAQTSELESFKKANNIRIQDAIYGSLATNARELKMDIYNDPFYAQYVARDAMHNTPKEVEQSWGEKAADVAKSLADTVVGTAAITSDTLGITNNAYKGWFGNRTELTGKEGMGSKAWDLFFYQQAWLDVGFAAVTALSGGMAAPAWITAKTAAGVGLKTAGKTAFKLLEKEGAKAGAELFSKELFKEGLEQGTKALEGNLIKGLTERLGIDLAEQTVKAFRSGDGIADLIKNGVGKFSGKEIADSLSSVVTKEFGENLSAKGMQKLNKSLGKFTQMSDTIHGVNTLTSAGKAALAGSHMIDALGVPGLSLLNLAPRGIKATAEEATKGLGGAMAKQGLKFDTSVMRIGMYGGLPFAGTLPGVGGWIQNHVMMVGSYLAGEAAKTFRVGVTQTERQKFKDQYGIDPYETKDVGIMASFENQLNYKIRHSLPSEILTGTAYKDRGLMGQATTSILDGIANMSGLFAGHMAIGKAVGITSAHLSPISVVDGKIVSNISFIKSLDEIHARYKAGDISNDQRTAMVKELNESIKDESTGFVKTIRTTQELETTLKEIQEYVSVSKQLTPVDAAFIESIKNIPVDISNAKNRLEAISVIENANRRVTDYANELMSDTNFQKIKDKAELLFNYSKKVAESTSFINQITKPIAVNFFTSDLLSPTTAALTYNAISEASVSAFAKVISVTGDMMDVQEKTVQLFANKGKLYDEFTNTSTYGKLIEQQIFTNLKKNNYSDKDAKIVTANLGKILQTELTQVYLKLKDSGDLVKLTNEVFGDFGVRLRKIVKESSREKGSVASIIARMGGTDEGVATLSSIVRSTIDKKYSDLLKEKDALALDYRKHATELVELDRSKSEAIALMNAENESIRNQKLSIVPTDKIEPMTEQQKEFAMEYVRENYKDSELKSFEKAIEEDLAYNEYKTDLRNSDIDNIADYTDAVSKLEGNEVADSAIKIENEFKSEKVKNENLLKQSDNVILTMHLANKLAKQRLDAAQDIPSAKTDDDIDRNTLKIKSHYEIFDKEIDTSKLFAAALDLSDGIKLKDVFVLNDVRNNELQKVFKKAIQTLNYDEKMSPESAQAAKDQILGLVNEAMGKSIKPVTMDTMRDFAKESESSDHFLVRVASYLTKDIGFTPEYAKKIMENTFTGKETYLYNQYKSTEKASFVNIDLNGNIVFSKDTESDFLDANGNNTHLYRIMGLGDNVMKNSGAVIVNKFFAAGVEKDPLIAFSKSSDVEKYKDMTGREVFDIFFGKYIETMDKKGYEFVGSFQEEGKKLIFVPKEYGAKRFLSEATGVDIDKVNSLPEEYRAVVGANLAKRGKLFLWGELSPDITTLRKFRPNRQDDNIRTLYFDDSLEVDGQKKDLFDGETLVFGHIANVLNETIAATPQNKTWKPVIVGDKGNAIKSQSSLINQSHLKDPMFQAALNAFAEKSTDTYMGLRLSEIIENWKYDTEEGRSSILSFIRGGGLIDMMTPASSYKNVYSKIPDDVLQASGIGFTRPKVGDITEFPHNRMAFKSIDFGITTESATKETVTFSNQVFRGLFDLSKDLDKNLSVDIKAVYNILNNIRVEESNKIGLAIKRIPEDPVGVLQEIANDFGVKYSDYNYQNFVNTGNIKSVINMLSNILEKHVVSALTLKGNSLRIRSVPMYNTVRTALNKELVAKFGNDSKDNWMIVDRNTYGHLAGKTLGDTRFMAIRYPVVGPKVINMPRIIFSDEIGRLVGDESFRPSMDDGVAISHKLMEKFEGDNDGDKLFVFTDPRLNSVSKNIANFSDSTFNNKSEAVNTSIKKSQKKSYTAQDALGVFQEAGIDFFEGKKNIGKIDKQATIADVFMRMGLINRDTLTGLGTPQENFIAEIGKLEQKAVDNQEIFMNDLYDLTKRYFSTPIEYYVNSPIPGISLSKIYIGDDKHGFWQHTANAKNEVSIPVIPSDTAMRAIQSTLDNISSKDYKVSKDKRGNKIIIIINPAKASLFNKQLKAIRYSTFEKNLRNVLAFIGKTEYINDAPIQKSVETFEKSYENVKESFTFFNDIDKHYLDKNNYLFDFIEKMSGQFENFSSKTFSDLRQGLNKKVGIAFQNVQKEFPFEINSQNKKQVEEISELIKNYRNIPSIDKDAKKVAKNAIIDFKKENPSFNFDNYLINSSKHNLIQKDLLSRSSKERMGKMMEFYLTVGKLNEFEKVIGQDKIDYLKSTMGTNEFEGALSKVIDLNDNLQLEYAINSSSLNTKGIQAPESIKALYEEGVSPEELTDVAKRISSLPEKERKDIFQGFNELTANDVYAIKDLLDDDSLKEIATAIGLRDITRNEAAKKAFDAAKNSDKVYDPKFSNC